MVRCATRAGGRLASIFRVLCGCCSGRVTYADKAEGDGVRTVPAGTDRGRGTPSHPMRRPNTLCATTATARYSGIGFHPADRHLTGMATITVGIAPNRTRVESWKQNREVRP